jgi:hypothetical protein
MATFHHHDPPRRSTEADGNEICFPYEILCRLPGGAIAACQCVCRAWRAIDDVVYLLSVEFSQFGFF